MISVENLTKGYAGRQLFQDISFKINHRERVGLVGRNGHGKTTLFRIIAGEEQPDAGAITIPRHYRIGYVHQQLEFIRDTVLEEALRGLPGAGEHQHWIAEKILAGLGFSPADMNRHPAVFSGGYQVRLNLARVLVSEPDLLLLDEPTNYLDITSIRWIEQFLLGWPHELMLITHDRSFMDKIATHTLGIHRTKIRKIAGSTEKYYAQVAQDEEVYEKTRLKDERRRKEAEQFIARFRAKARLANLVQSRIKAIEKLEKRSRLEKLKTLDFAFRAMPFKGKYVLSARDLCFSYAPETKLIDSLGITVRTGERICIVGRNGKGKTTLLRLLAGELQPQCGEAVCSPGVTRGFFEQTNSSRLVGSRTVEEEIACAHPDVDRQTARGICGAMMFEEDDALKKIRVLSGGEKSRVMLGKLLATPVNMLLLDEPTNHLDMQSCDALLAALDSFEGTVVMVTHNEMFLHALAERLIVFKNDRISVFEGSYGDFLAKEGWENENGAPAPAAKHEHGEEPAGKVTKRELRRRRSEIITERGRALRPLEQRIARIESDIERHDDTIRACNRGLQDASEAQDSTRIAELSRLLHESQSAVDALFEDLEQQTVQCERLGALFEERLKELE